MGSRARPDATGRRGSLLREEFLDVPVVFEQEVELDQVVDPERRAGRELPPRILGELVLLVEEQVRIDPAGAAAALDVDAGGDEQCDDLPVGALLDVVRAGGAGEAVAPFLPVVADRQEDRLGSHVDLSAPRARRPDGCHLTGVIGPGAKGLEQTSAERGYPMWAGQVAYRARVRRAKSWT